MLAVATYRFAHAGGPSCKDCGNIMRALILTAAFAAPCIALGAEGFGAITILEGPALIYRASGRLHAAEGLRIDAGDIVETAGGTFVQLEFDDRTVAQFGPNTRVMIHSGAGRQKSERWLHFLEGWLKLNSLKRDTAAGPGFELRAAAFEIPAAAVALVLRTAPARVDLFVEAGSMRMAERVPGSRAVPLAVSVNAGEFYQRKPPARGVVTGGVSQAFLADMPRAFRDSLPLRADRFRDHAPEPRSAPDFGYADVAPWLQAEPSVRRPLMQRWRGKAREPAFRAGLVANLAAHPEWDPILFPEKYRPKPRVEAQSAAAGARAPSAASP